MTGVDWIGYAAAGAVAATYSMRTMVPLRVAGLASNVLFIVYGALSGAQPVLVLHVILLPLNAWRLHQLLAARADGPVDGRDDHRRRPRRRPRAQAGRRLRMRPAPRPPSTTRPPPPQRTVQ